MNATVPSHIAIRQSLDYDKPIQAIAMAGWNRLLSVGGDNKVRLHNPETGKVIETFESFQRYVSGIRPLDDQRVLLEFGTEFGLLDLDSGNVEEADGSPDGRSKLGQQLSLAQIAIAPMLAPVTFVAPRTNEIVAEAQLDTGRIVYATEDCLKIARNQYFHVWNVHNGRETGQFYGTDSQIISLIALDAHRVLSSHVDQKFRIWDMDAHTQDKRLEHRCGVAGPLACVDGTRLLFAPINPSEAQQLDNWDWPASDSTLRLWDIEAGTELATLQCAAPILQFARLDHARFWARDEQSCLHLIEVLS